MKKIDAVTQDQPKKPEMPGTVSIRSLGDLKIFGVVALTGEACKFGTRVLCDVTAAGAEMLSAYFQAGLTLEKNWNQGDPSDPHIGSIMIDRAIATPLAKFALLHNGALLIAESERMIGSGSVVGIFSEHWKKQYEDHNAKVIQECASENNGDQGAIWKPEGAPYRLGMFQLQVNPNPGPRMENTNTHEATGRTMKAPAPSMG